MGRISPLQDFSLEKMVKEQYRLYVVSLGCPKNLVDTETMLGSLIPEGYRLEGDPARAEAILINTCSFIEPARQETLDTIEECLEFKRRGRARAVVVAGCMATSHRKRPKAATSV